jgi:hypothetical protein
MSIALGALAARTPSAMPLVLLPRKTRDRCVLSNVSLAGGLSANARKVLIMKPRHRRVMNTGGESADRKSSQDFLATLDTERVRLRTAAAGEASVILRLQAVRLGGPLVGAAEGRRAGILATTSVTGYLSL